MLPAICVRQGARTARCARIFKWSCLFGLGIPTGLSAQTSQILAARLIEVGLVRTPSEIHGVPLGAFGAKGALAIVEDRKGLAVLLDSSFRHQTILGRSGDGPGEFRNIRGLFWVADSLIVSDFTQRRLSFFVDGTRYLKSVSQAIWAYSTMSTFALLPSGEWLGIQKPTPGGGPLSSRDSDRVVSVRGDRPQISKIILTRYSGPTSLAVQLAKGRLYIGQPYLEPVFVAFSSRDHSLVEVQTKDGGVKGMAEISVRWLNLDGSILKQRVHKIAVTPLGSSKRDSLVAATIALYQNSAPTPLPSQEISNFRRVLGDSLYVPAFVPPVVWFQVDRQGDVWIVIAGVGNGAGQLCRIGSEAASPTLCAPIPSRIFPLAVDIGGRVVFLRVDADDVPTLVEFRLTR